MRTILLRLLAVISLMAVLPATALGVEAPSTDFNGATIYVPEGEDPEPSPEQRTVVDVFDDGLPRDQAIAGRKISLAAQDLADYVKKMTGVELKVAKVKDVAAIPKDSRCFVLGSLATKSGLKVPTTEFRIDGFAYDVNGKQVRLAGETALSTMYAVSSFLERQGVRWFLPGSWGEHVPKRQTLDLPDAPVSETPSILSRNSDTQPGKDTLEYFRWAIRNKAMGGLEMDLRRTWTEVWEPFGGQDKALKARPELFGEVNGLRVPGQWNLSSPELAHLFANQLRKRLKGRPKDVRTLLSFHAEDGFIIDTSAESRKLIIQNDPVMLFVPDSSELVARMVNWTVEDLNKDYPNVRLCFFLYANYQIGPQKVKLNPNLIPVFSPLALDRYHWVGDPRSPTQYMLGQTIERLAKSGTQFGWCAYSFGGGDCVMPVSRLDAMSHNITWLYSKGLRYWSIKTVFIWPNIMPEYYVMSKLLWNVNTDQKKLLDEYHTLYFGKAAGPMSEYTRALNSMYDLPFCAGNREFAGAVFTKERLRQLRGLMDAATKAVRDDPVRAHRVRMQDHVLRMGETHMAIRDAINRFEFEKAGKLNAEMYALFNEANAHDSNTSTAEIRDGWNKTFYSDNVATIAGWTKDAKILHRFPDEWPAFLDAPENGERLGALQGETPLFNHLKLKTYSACLAEQGLERTRGAIWYRMKFPTVSAPAGKKLYLLVGGFDDALTAWVDGRELGRKSSGSFGPAILELPELSTDRREHTLTIRVTNKGITELGTGGIVRPVCIIARDPLPPDPAE